MPVGMLLVCLLSAGGPSPPQELGRGRVFSVVEVLFSGPEQGPRDTPARDVELWALFRHESGTPEYRVWGFWDGDGNGGARGGVFKVRFCPTAPGRWYLVAVRSDRPELNGQHQGDFIVAEPSDHPGFWLPDPESADGRWYRRSDGSHPYIVGNTHYSFLSGYRDGNRPSGNEIVRDVLGNARYFKKLRFSLLPDRYPDPEVLPFFDDLGRPTDAGEFAHRPNPTWFFDRVDRAVQAAYQADLIADLILAGPDTEASRSTLKAEGNEGDPTPYLRYVAARYGSYPNVWLCLANEFDIKRPSYTEEEVARCGRILREHLPYPTPLSVHASPGKGWLERFGSLGEWNDHQIIQRKLRRLAPAADAIRTVSDRYRRPTINDELSYQGAGDRHSEEDTIEAHLGAFLGGGYGTTGYKPANKLGQYFWGNFEPQEHTAADNLAWLRAVIEAEIAFWRMRPLEDPSRLFEGLPPGSRALGWEGREYALGTDRPQEGIVVHLPEGWWRIVRYDVIRKEAVLLVERAEGSFSFEAPESRAVLFHLRRLER